MQGFEMLYGIPPVILGIIQKGVLTLSKSTKFANMSIEDFLQKLAAISIVVVDQTTEELESDLEAING